MTRECRSTIAQPRRGAWLVLAALIALQLGGCGSAPQRQEAPNRAEKPVTGSAAKPGGYYQDDGPGASPPPNLEAVPDAEPKIEPLHKYANNPYTVLGQQYVPENAYTGYKTRGIASWYGRKFHGQKTSSGEPYDMYGMSAAHPTLPIPSYARVTNARNGKSVIVRINDRGPFHSERVIDLSYTAAFKLGIVQNGSGQVLVEAIDPSNLSAKPVPTSAPEQQQTAAMPALPVVSDRSGIYLQLGAFSSQQNAESFGSRIRQQMGALADAMQILSANGLYRVHLGPYRSQAEAAQAAALLQQNLNVTALQLVR
jgi:rare lipoprotein A